MRSPSRRATTPSTRRAPTTRSGTAQEREATPSPEEPFYGRTYMPRKFKIGFAIPPSNDIDVYSQDLGFIAIARRGRLKGFNVAIGGGLGRTDQAPQTYPRLAERDRLSSTPDELFDDDRRGDVGPARLRRPGRPLCTRASNTPSTTRDSTGSRPRSSGGSASRSRRRSPTRSPRTATRSAGSRARTAASTAPCSSRTAASSTRRTVR